MSMSEHNAVKFCTNSEYFSNVVDELLNNVSLIEPSGDLNSCGDSVRIMSRTRSDPREEFEKRNKDYNKALSMQPFDPLWMLTRQWQFGRFQGNDCGTPVSVKVFAKKKKIIDADQSVNSQISGNIKEEDVSPNTPLEYEVEKVNYEITPYVRVESAMFLKKMLIRTGLNSVISQLEEQFVLPDFVENPWNKANSDKESLALEKLKAQKNKALKRFTDFYGKRSFDGYEVYLKMTSKSLKVSVSSDKKKSFDEVQTKYVSWFKNKFLPNDNLNHWNSKKLAYEVTMHEGKVEYSTDQYASGKLSWYSFDALEKVTSTKEQVVEKNLFYIPTPAKIPGSPSQRLWEFENRKVVMGNGDLAPEYMASAVVMQYISTYSNDWMITPLETETGTVLDVGKISVTNTFGEMYDIEQNAEDIDKNAKTVGPTDRWCLFGSSRPDAYYNKDKKSDFSCCKGLLFPPTVLRCEEGAPIEEVQFLRDEMANMLWGVETKINDGCGGSMDGQTLSDAVFKEVDKQRKEDKSAATVDAKYSLLIQNRVPLNWIPFIPQQLEDGRNITFRRGRMPIYYKCEDDTAKEAYKSVRPSTMLLAVERDGEKVKPFCINEEEVGGYGIRVTKTPQRTRWFMGESFNWIGNRKIVSEYQANSGLMFDELLKKDSGEVKVNRKNKSQETAPEKTEEV